MRKFAVGFAKPVWIAAIMASTAFSVQAQQAVNTQLSAQIVAWGQASVKAFAEAMGASRVPVGAVPVPPQIDVPCNLCGQQNTVANGSQLAQAWVDQAMQPEVNDTVTFGLAEPVNQTLKAEKNGNRIELTISVRQAPQQ